MIWFEKFRTRKSLLSLYLSLLKMSLSFSSFWHILLLISSSFLYCVLALFYLLYLHCLSFTELLRYWMEFPPNLQKKKCWSLFLQISNLFFQLLLQLWKYSILSHRKLAVFFQGFYLFVSSLFCILDSLLLWLYVHWCSSAAAILM